MSWEKVRLGELITESRSPSENPDPDRRITVRLKVLGVEKRPLENEKAGATKQFIRKAGQFIYGKQNFHKGAFGIIPIELDGFESSADLPSFDVRKDCLPEWIFYFFKQGGFYLELAKIARGVATQRIHPEQIYDLEIPLPDIKTQKEIINLIRAIEEKGDKLNNELTYQLTQLENLNQAILQEAVQGKLVPQDSKDEPASELLKRIKAALRQAQGSKKAKELPPIKPEEIPFKIPENWVWCRLGEIALSISTGPFGTMLHQSDYVENGIPLINPMNIVNEKIVRSDKMMVNDETAERLKTYILRKDDIVIGRRGEMGRCAVVTDNEIGWLCGTGSFFLRLHNDIYRSFFIKVLRSKFSKSFLLAGSVGATMNNLNHRILSNLPIPLPPLSEQKRIVAEIEKQLAKTKQLKEHIIASQQATGQLLKALLHQAFEVKEVEEV